MLGLRLSLAIAVVTHCCSFGVTQNLPPVFVNDINSLLIKENTKIGSSVYKLEGRSQNGGKISFAIRESNFLEVDRDSGVVRISNNIDREVMDSLKFFVSIEESLPGNSSTNKVEMPAAVIIIDENDEKPLFEKSIYESDVFESVSVGATVIPNIHVTDKDHVGNIIDVSCSSNSQFLADSCSVFDIIQRNSSINHFEGSLILRRPIDTNQQPIYIFSLNASDGVNNSTSTIVIHVKDAQNKPPIFKELPIGNISQKNNPGSLVLVVKAQDGDEINPHAIAYHLVTNPEGAFTLDTTSGELRTAKHIHRKNFKSGIIEVKIKAEEVTMGSLPKSDLTSSEITALIRIHDINEEPPRFNHKELSVTMYENLTPQKPVPNMTLFVEDPDEDLLHSEMKISLVDPFGFFSISPTNITRKGRINIIVEKALDYENPNHRQFITMVVAEKGQVQSASTATVTININDVNDNFPKFTKESYDARVSEVAPPGTAIMTIIAVDSDSENYGTQGIRYSLSGNGAEKFRVDETSGRIFVAECENPGRKPCLDHEDQKLYQLIYSARDDKGIGLENVVPVQIVVEDSNDNSPKFETDLWVVYLRKDDDNNSLVTLKATDMDQTASLVYELNENDLSHLFSIDSHSGAIQIINRTLFDMHTNSTGIKRFNLTASVTDGINSAAIKATIKVILQEFTNAAPIFESFAYTVNVSEGAKEESVVLELHASDPDEDRITYQILSGSHQMFNINSTTGSLKVAKGAHLNFNRRQYYQLQIAAKDESKHPQTATTTVLINITDTLTDPPKFLPPVQRAQVFKGSAIGSIFYQLQLEPNTEMQPKFLRYFMITTDLIVDRDGKEISSDDHDSEQLPFTLDENSGQIKVSGNLSLDQAAEYTVVMTAVYSDESHSLTGIGTLVVTVVETNSEPPVFPLPWSLEDPVVHIDVVEEQPEGSIVYTLVAFDPDSSIAGYAIVPDDPYFQIDGVSGVVTTKTRIDYESLQASNFSVIAFDTGIPQLSAVALVFVNILNINDNDPVFNQSIYKAEIVEHPPEGTWVTKVFADDGDLGELGKTSFTLNGEHSDKFRIDNEGNVLVALGSELDRENITTLDLEVVAIDNGANNPNESSIIVPLEITLLDINDHAPKFFQKEYSIFVINSMPIFPPMPILQVAASDEDEGLNGLVQYKITDGNENDTFTLNGQTGILYPAKSLNEGPREYHLQLRASDNNGTGPHFDTASVSIQVQDLNQHPPKFIVPDPKNATITVLENQPAGIVLTVLAIDPDSGINVRVEYFFRVFENNTDSTEEFLIDVHSGVLSTRGPLDHEKQDKYLLILVARDAGLPTRFESLLPLVIYVKDLDDNPPAFPRSMFTMPYSFAVEENQSVGSLVGQVQAFDKDTGDGTIYYHIAAGGNGNSNFAIDNKLGHIYTNASLDFEAQQCHMLVIIATSNADFTTQMDSSQKIQSSQCQTRIPNNITIDASAAFVRVDVLDVNDNIPFFTENNLLISISRNSDVRAFVHRMTAIDLDREDAKHLQYHLDRVDLFHHKKVVDANIKPPPFYMEQDGTIRVARQLANYDQKIFEITVVVREGTTLGRLNKAVVKVWVCNPKQLLQVLIDQPIENLKKEIEEIAKRISNSTNRLVIVHDIQGHPERIDGQSRTEVIILLVDQNTDAIVSTEEAMEASQSINYYEISNNIYFVESVSPLVVSQKTEVDVVIIALIALGVVLFIGALIIVAIISWKPRTSRRKAKPVLIDRNSQFVDPISTTENPLWIDK